MRSCSGGAGRQRSCCWLRSRRRSRPATRCSPSRAAAARRHPPFPCWPRLLPSRGNGCSTATSVCFRASDASNPWPWWRSTRKACAPKASGPGRATAWRSWWMRSPRTSLRRSAWTFTCPSPTRPRPGASRATCPMLTLRPCKTSCACFPVCPTTTACWPVLWPQRPRCWAWRDSTTTRRPPATAWPPCPCALKAATPCPGCAATLACWPACRSCSARHAARPCSRCRATIR